MKKEDLFKQWEELKAKKEDIALSFIFTCRLAKRK